ncbi:MAG TPA: enolase C-terminal domain-like protein [Parafilimonas sp.]
MKLYEDTVIEDLISIKDLKVSAYKIPTSTPESDGTIEWNSTTLILVEIIAANKTGIGYTYANEATAIVIDKTLRKIVVDANAFDIPLLNAKMIAAIRNDGQVGIAMMAVSAVDNALWDLKAKLFDVPLCNLLGKAKDSMLIYGSGGFTSYNKKQLQQQLSSWVNEGIQNVKIKIGTLAEKDVERVKEARDAIGENVKLFVDANGAYTIKQAIEKSFQFASYNISWFEEPVTSDNLEGLQFIREHVQPEVSIAAGEYGYNLPYFHHMLKANAVDILQADTTRCGGITNFLKAASLAEAQQIPFSSHCAPALHLHAALSLNNFYIAEYFYDHARIENMLFDGVMQPEKGCIYPDESRAGMGIEFKYKDAEKYKV